VAGLRECFNELLGFVNEANTCHSESSINTKLHRARAQVFKSLVLGHAPFLHSTTERDGHKDKHIHIGNGNLQKEPYI